ncbi:MAG: pantoate--beta-alanine ligase [Chitinophagaceae bacterium]|nr:pantoate--beta-alanine ligase [Chitinophagaceae bacterium]MBK9485782.1 pantoate--beta-alanine ligase [Chitinophagaceae bacterium]MBL0201089.1 pantoate--beta-alanine ligase [Chitinophagaceae bacterium]
MILFKKAADITAWLLKSKTAGKKIGFIPTMGALHPGHISLIKASKKAGSISVCSIFVNPAQFNDAKDFDNYPSTIEKDIDALEKAGCDILFLPSVSEMYPAGMGNAKTYDLGYLETVLEGEYRPGHFQGVCLVVHRLLNIIPADDLYLGQKDYQQCMVIKKLVELENINTTIHICPTLRETSGLAMSSRNMRLTEESQKQALKIFETLSYLKNNSKPGNLTALKQTAIDNLTNAGFKVDYIEIADAGNLDIINHWDGNSKLVAVAAAFLGEVRLIDNMLL